ncbi:MAG: NADPH-dependent glutamate synthase [Candidatus Izemoplasmatales bacterium]|nr:NADPH-dependent glutamate synthase [Candidatus Izemoplasmatales bacterium]MDD3865889.1 NADPH-dependent glutamate synthase [Candidatus Izemoplasmatales bacterium]
MINKSMIKNHMITQKPEKRIHNYREVSQGYTNEQALDEAKRCLECKNKPCVKGCPVRIDIPGFIHRIVEHDIEGAYQIIRASSLLPAVCGRVCPQETQCEELCVRKLKGESVAIGHLERFVADYHSQNNTDKPIIVPTNGIKIAIVGSGPAGLSCANDLVKKGYQVDIYEALHIPGGVLVYGIPEFRLPKAVVEREISALIKQGVNIYTNVIIGKTLTIDDLFTMGYRAVFLGTGAGLPKFMGIPGEMLNGVYSANEYLTRINLMKAYDGVSKTPIQSAQRVAVIGGGNVALDAARWAKRLGAKTVSIIYRRSRTELPARYEEVVHAEEEGIIFRMQTNLQRIIGDDFGFVKKIQCVEMTLGELDDSGRARPIEKPGSEHFIDVDSVIMAIGTTPNPLISQSTIDLKTNQKGCIITTNNTGLTTKDMVYAGGDVVTGSATVILAMGAGREAAQAIDEKVTSDIFKKPPNI